MHAGVLLSLHIHTGNHEAGVKFVNLCFVIVARRAVIACIRVNS